MAVDEMDGRNWRCVIHLNTTSEVINNNLLTRLLMKLNHIIPESNLTSMTNLMKFPPSVPVIVTRM